MRIELTILRLTVARLNQLGHPVLIVGFLFDVNYVIVFARDTRKMKDFKCFERFFRVAKVLNLKFNKKKFKK